ncbi:struthiocalcin-1-like [Elgaria multicarinata webbii]|uniref:struthiocalcin-1-like n=1 Tax=Elgaria multicarinata webbii TaxID=159646 RepID=UPI002FCD3727
MALGAGGVQLGQAQGPGGILICLRLCWNPSRRQLMADDPCIAEKIKKMGLMACFSIGLLGCLVGGPFLGGVHADKGCPQNWLGYNGRCYGYFPQEVTWQQAERRCQQSGGHLASILNVNEHKAIARFLRQSQGDDDEDVWLGLSIKNRKWAWVDGSPVEYTAWEEYESYDDLDDEHCAQLEDSSGFMQWDNESCFDKNPFLCKV